MRSTDIIAAEYVECVCKLLEPAQSAQVRLGGTVELLLTRGTKNMFSVCRVCVLLPNKTEQTVTHIWTFMSMNNFIAACEQLGWTYMLDNPQEGWDEALLHSKARRRLSR